MAIAELPRSRGVNVMKARPSGLCVANPTSPQAIGLKGWFVGERAQTVTFPAPVWQNNIAGEASPDYSSGTLTKVGDAEMGSVAQLSGASGVRILTNYGLGTANTTLTAWVYLSGTMKGAAVAQGSSDGYCIGIGDGTNMDGVGTTVMGLFSSRRWINTGVSYGTAGWHLLAMTLPPSGGGVIIYLDGRRIYSDALGAPSAGTRLAIGAEGPATRTLNTLYADVRFYNRALDDAEHFALFNPATRWDLYRPSSRRTFFTVPAVKGLASPAWRPSQHDVPNGIKAPQPNTLQSAGLNGWLWDGTSWSYGPESTARVALTGANSGATASQFGPALRFNGTSDYVVVANNASMGRNNPNQTFAAWVYLNSYGGASQLYLRGIMSRYSNGIGVNGVGTTFRVGNDATAGNKDKLNFVVVKSDASELGVSATTPFPLGGWHHVVGTYDGTTVRLYMDGQMLASNTGTGYGWSGTSSLYIGADFAVGVGGGSPRAWDGFIADVRTYCRALACEEVFAMYAPRTRLALYEREQRAPTTYFTVPSVKLGYELPGRGIFGNGRPT